MPPLHCTGGGTGPQGSLALELFTSESKSPTEAESVSEKVGCHLSVTPRHREVGRWV